MILKYPCKIFKGLSPQAFDYGIGAICLYPIFKQIFVMVPIKKKFLKARDLGEGCFVKLDKRWRLDIKNITLLPAQAGDSCSIGETKSTPHCKIKNGYLIIDPNSAL